MQNDLNAITVYGASSPDIDEKYLKDGRETGRLIAQAGYTLVSGGGRYGLMGAAIEGANVAGGTTVGILPEFMDARGWSNPALTRKIVVPDMHVRKATFMGMSAGVIALAGGIGTFEELLEAITWRKLNLYGGRVVILNTDGYYDPVIEMLRRAVELKFMSAEDEALYYIASTPAEAVAAIIR